MSFSEKRITACLIAIIISMPQLTLAAIQSPTPNPPQATGEVKVVSPGDVTPPVSEIMPPAILSDMMPRQEEDAQKSIVPAMPLQVARLPKQIDKNWDFVPQQSQTESPTPPEKSTLSSPLTPAPFRSVLVESDGGAAIHLTPQLRTESVLPQSMNIFKPAQFRFSVINDSPVTAEGVNLTISIDGQGRVLSTNPADAVQQSDAIYFSVGNLNAGERRECSFEFQAGEAGQITVTPRITSSSTNSVSIAVNAPKIGIDIVGETEFVVGQKVSQKITIRNDGMETVQNLLVRQACSPASALQNASFAKNAVIPSLAPGQTAELELTAIAVQTGTANLQFAVEGDNVRSAMSKQIELAQSQLAAQMTGPELTYVNSLVTYAITVTNDQHREMENVKVTLSLPAGMIVKIVDRKSEFDATSSTLSWSIPKLAAGGSDTIPFKATMSQFGDHILKTTISNEAGTLTHSQLSTQVVGRADVDMKLNTTSDPVEIGSITEVTVNVQNRGTDLAENVQVTVKLPQTLVASESENCTITGNGVQFKTFALAAGQSETLTIKLKCSTAGDHVLRAEVQSSASSRIIAAENSLFYYSSEIPKTAESDSGAGK